MADTIDTIFVGAAYTVLIAGAVWWLTWWGRSMFAMLASVARSPHRVRIAAGFVATMCFWPAVIYGHFVWGMVAIFVGAAFFMRIPAKDETKS